MATARHILESEREALSPLAYCEALQGEYEAATKLEDRKAKGQVFTPASVARLMAGLLSASPREMTLLDPGAGIGVLTAAVCERAIASGNPRHIDAHLFETDEAILPWLERLMGFCERSMRAAGHGFSFRIYAEDFILDGPVVTSDQLSLFGEGPKFDGVIMNPPYFKVGVDSPHARSMAGVMKLHTNIYPLFMAKAADALRPGGEMVAITPRSFCNGLYFRDFRRWFFSRVDLRHVHLFECRRSTFDDVLQESVITLAQKTAHRSESIRVSTTFGRDIPDELGHIEVPRRRVMRAERGDTLVDIPVSRRDCELLELTDSWPARFADLGLKVSTGPVVTFRAERFLLPKPDGGGSAPLIAPHNVKAFETVWPVARRDKPEAFVVSDESRKHLVPARNYVLLRRFTAKEEKRRLVASCFLASTAAVPYVAIENHVNYVYHASRDLGEDEVYGLAAVFNSAFFDSYFRIMSGNTQVNATELRAMKLPPLATIAAIGRRVRQLASFEPVRVERVVLDELGLDGALAEQLQDAVR